MVEVNQATQITLTLLIMTGTLLLLQFIMLTYIFMLAWLGVTAFTSLPVFIYFNIWNICQNATVLEGASLCLDPRQYGKDDLNFFLYCSDSPPPTHCWKPFTTKLCCKLLLNSVREQKIKVQLNHLAPGLCL